MQDRSQQALPQTLKPGLRSVYKDAGLFCYRGCRLHAIEPELATAGDHLEIKLLWEAQTSPELDYTVFVHLLDSAGQLVVNADSPPLSGQYPSTIWTPGEQILDSHILPLPDSLTPGEYQLAIGLYDQPRGERLPVATGDDRVQLLRPRQQRPGGCHGDRLGDGGPAAGGPVIRGASCRRWRDTPSSARSVRIGCPERARSHGAMAGPATGPDMSSPARSVRDVLSTSRDGAGPTRGAGGGGPPVLQELRTDTGAGMALGQ